jgi:hypothetical protein
MVVFREAWARHSRQVVAEGGRPRAAELTLLHGALSAGLHSEDDEECLELAKGIRLLLTDLAERTTQALQKKDEVGAAVTRLLQKANARAWKPGGSEGPGGDSK